MKFPNFVQKLFPICNLITNRSICFSYYNKYLNKIKKYKIYVRDFLLKMLILMYKDTNQSTQETPLLNARTVCMHKVILGKYCQENEGTHCKLFFDNLERRKTNWLRINQINIISAPFMEGITGTGERTFNLVFTQSGRQQLCNSRSVKQCVYTYF